jgi:hypothetical protein
MTEMDLRRDLEFAVGRMLNDDVNAADWYDRVRNAYDRLTFYRMEKKYVRQDHHLPQSQRNSASD